MHTLLKCPCIYNVPLCLFKQGHEVFGVVAKQNKIVDGLQFYVHI